LTGRGIVIIQFENLDHQAAEELLHRSTPDVVLSSYNNKYLLDDEQLQLYTKEGFIRLEGVLSGEALMYARKVVQAAVLLRKEKDIRTLKDKSQYEQSFLQCGYLCWDFPAIRDIVFGKRFAGIARDLMQVKHVRLWHDQALFKEPAGRHTDVHQDSSYWPIDQPEHTITLWLALNEVSREKGCLYFHPETHRSGIREYVDIFKNPHHPKALDPSAVTYTPLKPGDATFHSGLTFHGAGANTSNEMREGMTVIYLSDGLKFDGTDERNASHKSCQDLKLGDPIDTRYTPILI
jgi:ectoine hydroxylase-related dioxygenase (phytanoyl-CoA dioxygenase family)